MTFLNQLKSLTRTAKPPKSSRRRKSVSNHSQNLAAETLEQRQLLTNVSGDIFVDTVWDNTSEPYVLTGDLFLVNGATLSIRPGVTVQQSSINNDIFVRENSQLHSSDATLDVDIIVGDNSPGIVQLTNTTTSRYIDLHDQANGSLRNGRVSAGQVWKEEGATIQFSGMQFEGMTPISVNSEFVPQLAGNTFAAEAGVVVNDNRVTTNTYWNLPGVSRYEIQYSTLTILGSRLTIGSGNTVTSTNGGTSHISVGTGGELAANGVELKSDITVAARSASGAIDLTNCTMIEDLNLYQTSTGTVTGCQLNGEIEIDARSGVSIHHNDFSNVSNVILSKSSGPNFDLINNWWGSTNPQVAEYILVDQRDDAARPRANYSPMLSEPPGVGTSNNTSILGFTNGNWWLTQAVDGNLFDNSHVGRGPASAFRKVLSGDFNGDGRDDVAVWMNNGDWQIGLTNGSGQLSFSKWTGWRTTGVKEIHVGDFNNDGKDDIIGLFKNGSQGRWWVAQSTGTSFSNKYWGSYGAYNGITKVLVGNFDGLKGEDLVIVANSGTVWMVKTSNHSFQYQNSLRWSLNSGVSYLQSGDFNGDGRSDLLGVFGSGRQKDVFVAKSIGPTGFTSGKWSHWTINHSLDGVVVGDVTGDGKDDVVAVINKTNLWTGTSNGRGFSMQHWGSWGFGINGLRDLHLGQTNGDDRADLIARAKNGRWYAAESAGSQFNTRELARWSADADWLAVLPGKFSGPASTRLQVSSPASENQDETSSDDLQINAAKRLRVDRDDSSYEEFSNLTELDFWDR